LLASAAAEALARAEREGELHEKAEEEKKKQRWGAPD
jgi:hypothetical protein